MTSGTNSCQNTARPSFALQQNHSTCNLFVVVRIINEKQLLKTTFILYLSRIEIDTDTIADADKQSE